MKLAVIGSRDVPETQENLLTLLDWVKHLSSCWGQVTELVSGRCPHGGADRLAEMVYESTGARVSDGWNEPRYHRVLGCDLGFQLFPPKAMNAQGFLARNKQIADYADAGIALITKPLASSRGTAHTVGLMRQQGKRVAIVRGF